MSGAPLRSNWVKARSGCVDARSRGVAVPASSAAHGDPDGCRHADACVGRLMQDRALSESLRAAAADRLNRSARTVERLASDHLRDCSSVYVARPACAESRRASSSATLPRARSSRGLSLASSVAPTSSSRTPMGRCWRSSAPKRATGTCSLHGSRCARSRSAPRRASASTGRDRPLRPVLSAAISSAGDDPATTATPLEFWCGFRSPTGGRRAGALLIAGPLASAIMDGWSELTGARVTAADPSAASADPLIQVAHAFPELELRVSSSLAAELATLAETRRHGALAGLVALVIALYYQLVVGAGLPAPDQQDPMGHRAGGPRRSRGQAPIHAHRRDRRRRARARSDARSSEQQPAAVAQCAAHCALRRLERRSRAGRRRGISRVPEGNGSPRAGGWKLADFLHCFAGSDRDKLEDRLNRCFRDGTPIEIDLPRLGEAARAHRACARGAHDRRRWNANRGIGAGHHRSPASRGADPVPRLSRQPHGSAQSPLHERAPRARARAVAAPALLAAVRRPRPLQARERHARPLRGRRARPRGRRSADADRRHRSRRGGGPLRRRRVRAVPARAQRRTRDRRGRHGTDPRGLRARGAAGPGDVDHRERRHLPIARGRRDDRGRAPQLRHRAASREGERPQLLLPVRRQHGGGGEPALEAREPPAPRGRDDGVRDPLPAARPRGRRLAGLVRGTAALGRRRLRRLQARRVHPDRRGDRTDRPARRLGAAHGAPAVPHLARRTAADRVRLDQRLGPTAHARSRRRGPRPAERDRRGCVAPRDRSHRERRDRRRRRGHRRARRAAQARRPALARRLRHRLFVAQLSAHSADHRRQDRSLLRDLAGRERARHRAGGVDRRDGEGARTVRDRRGRRDRGAGRAAHRDGLRRAPGLPVRRRLPSAEARRLLAERPLPPQAKQKSTRTGD